MFFIALECFIVKVLAKPVFPLFVGYFVDEAQEKGKNSSKYVLEILSAWVNPEFRLEVPVRRRIGVKVHLCIRQTGLDARRTA